MYFHSIDFAIFLPIVFLVYWFFPFRNLRLQNLWIVASSYVFYGWWDWRFLTLILLSTLMDYFLAIRIESADNKRHKHIWLSISIGSNLGLLGFFKYFNFFVESCNEAFTFLGNNLQFNTLNIVLPVGISFYTFQTMSYVIDVYKGKIAATRDFVAFTAYVSFFPQLVAGPIERATQLLPQFFVARVFNYKKAVDGLRQILWGLFKKVVFADNAALLVNKIYANSDSEPGSMLAIGTIFFAIQIYCDFSGYSDIAIGTARLFGFSLMRNFAYPFFSRDVAEFWRRWHISLSTWFRDYLYIPLGGSRISHRISVRNTFIIFVVSGFWHGARWNFIIWGFLHALYFLPLLLARKNRTHLDIVASNKLLPNFREIVQMLVTFCLTTFAWIFFRSESLSQATKICTTIFSSSFFTMPAGSNFIGVGRHPITMFGLLIFLFVIEWIGRHYQHPLIFHRIRANRFVRFSIYYILIFLIWLFGGQSQEFIYFQF